MDNSSLSTAREIFHALGPIPFRRLYDAPIQPRPMPTMTTFYFQDKTSPAVYARERKPGERLQEGKREKKKSKKDVKSVKGT